MTNPYNTSFMDNSTGITDLIIGINTNLDGLFISGILLIMWVIMFIVGRKNTEDVVALTGSSFIILIASILLYAAEVVEYHIIALPLVVFMSGLLAYFITNRN